MNYKDYQIEEEQPGQFYIYRTLEDWLWLANPLNVSLTVEDAKRYVDSLIEVEEEKEYVIQWSGSVLWSGRDPDQALGDFKAHTNVGWFMVRGSAFNVIPK